MPPPPRALKLPPQRLPAGKYVKVCRGKIGYGIVTAGMGLVVGGRLYKGKGIMPDGDTVGMDLQTATTQMDKWESFCEANSK